jgi:hypothetical protein
LPDGVYLKGNWQSPKYFADIAEIIRNEFTLKKRLTEKSLRLAELIDSNESVSIHVRRGDYAQTSNGLQHHGVCGEDYYCRCVDHIRQGVKHPQFFIFSDDPSWAADNFGHLEGSVFVDNDSHDACQDLWLMSHCKHNIIANSTFSWWGAWLNRHEGKIVLAPKQWFAEEVQFSMRTEDLFPSEWIAI